MKVFISFLLAALVPTAGWAQGSAGPLTVQRAVNTYLAKNLELQAARYRLERTRADQIAAALRPNPSLTLSAQNLKINGPAPPANGLYEIEASYSDTIELGGKRKLRQNVADVTVSAAEAQFADTMRRGIAEVKRMYFDALLAKYSVDIANENRQTFEQLVQFNLTRFQLGAIAESEVIRVRLERIKFDTAVRQSELRFRQAKIRLLERLGESNFSTDVAGQMEFRTVMPDLASLKQTALSARPDVQAAQREVEAADARLILEQARAKPDIAPFAGYKRLAADNTVLVGVSIPLKTRDRNQAGIARALADQKTARSQLELTRNRALADLESAYDAYQTSRDQVQTFRDALLNEADESRSIALAAYQEGATQLLPLLDAQRTRTEVRQEYFRTLFDYEASLIDLELALGKETPMKRFQWILIFAVALSAIACGRVGSADNGAGTDRAFHSKETRSSTEIVLTASQQADFGIAVEATRWTDQPEILEVPGEINLPDNGHWHIGVLASGRIEQVNVNLGDFVHEGDLLARMHSHDVHDARAAYLTSRSDLTRAQAAANLARVNYDRAQRLYELKAGSLSELDRARQELANAEASVHDEQIELEKERIHLEGNLGVPADPAPGVSEDEADLIPIRAAGTGYVLAKNVTPGTVVDQTKDLFIIADLRRVWMIASVNEANIGKVRLGEAAIVKTNAFPMESFNGRVTNLSPELDPVTRAMRVRVELENLQGKLRGEMLATARIVVGPPKQVLTVSGEAIQQINDSDVVFIREGEDRFEIRPVHLGEMFNGRVVVLEGVKPGEGVVSHGSFILKSELLKSSIE